MRNTRPRTFEEVVAAQDPTKMASLTRGDRFVDPSVNAFHGEVSVSTGEWRVEYFDDDGGRLRYDLRRSCSREAGARLFHLTQVWSPSYPTRTPSAVVVLKCQTFPVAPSSGDEWAIRPRASPSISSAARPAAVGSIAVISAKCSSTKARSHTRCRINRNDSRTHA